MPNDNVKKSLAHLKRVNDEMEDFLDNLEEKIDKLDVEYLKMKAQDDIAKAKLAKEILKKK